jgi:hypothetical protein
MPYAREYSAADALRMINRSEALVVRNGVRGTGAALGVDEDYTAHTISRHLLKGSPGARGAGVAFDAFRDRFLGSPENRNSGWAGKGEMAILLCEALNSVIGQHALGQLDKRVTRVMVHYLNLGKLAALTGRVALKESSYAVTPAHDIVNLVPVMNTKTNQPVMVKGVAKMIPVKTHVDRSVAAKVTAADIASVNLVLDRFGAGELHLQTFFPSSEASASYAEWTLGMMKIVAAYDGSRVLSRMMPSG